MAKKPTTIDEYLATVSAPQRAALQKIRAAVHAAAPRAEECISYQLPAFRQGRVLVAFGATQRHCAFYLMSPAVLAAHGAALAKLETSKGTIRFQPDKPLTATLVKKLVKARLAEELARDGAAAPRPRATVERAAPRPARSVARAAQHVGSRTDPAVDELMRALEHPLKSDLQAARKLVLAASPDVHEGVKWNAPSFRTSDYFATLDLRTKDTVRFVFHTGAKSKDSRTKGVQVDDPEGLLQWLAKDRALVTLGRGAELRRKGPALQALVRAWITLLDSFRVTGAAASKRARPKPKQRS
jgi:uncharacterized protein YdhG (YjbR/CyaY superfamily)